MPSLVTVPWQHDDYHEAAEQLRDDHGGPSGTRDSAVAVCQKPAYYAASLNLSMGSGSATQTGHDTPETR